MVAFQNAPALGNARDGPEARAWKGCEGRDVEIVDKSVQDPGEESLLRE